MTAMQDRDSNLAVAAAATNQQEPGRHTGDAGELTDGVVAALRSVFDPEIPVNIYDLGLIYRLSLSGPGFVEIDMTLTAPGCPVAGDIVKSVEQAVQDADGVSGVKVTLVFEPPWDKSRMSDDVKLELGLL
jgi:FeS assembly SUF system protein